MLLASLLLLVASSTEPSDSLEQELQRLAQPLIDGEVVPGLVVSWIAEDGSAGQFGLGSTKRGGAEVPDGQTIFEIGSVTKTFTALLLAQAVLAERVSLETDLNELLPAEFRMPRSQHPVQLVQLATHTSGFPGIPSNLERDMSRFFVDYSDYPESSLQRFLNSCEPLTEPGSSYLYSNAGFGVLGWALGQQASTSYEDLVLEEICAPLQLADTGFALSSKSEARAASSHDPNGNPVPPAEFSTLVACGGLRSTADDMLRYLRAHLEPTEPLRASIELASRPHFSNPKGLNLGLAWHILPDGQTRFHDGQTGGQACFVFFDRSRGIAGLVLANASTQRIADLGLRIQRKLHGLPIDPPLIRMPVNVEATQLERLVGVYRTSLGFEMTVTTEADRLYAQIQRQPPFRLFPDSPTSFFYRDIVADVVFEIDEESGRAKELVLQQNGRDIRYRRHE